MSTLLKRSVVSVVLALLCVTIAGAQGVQFQMNLAGSQSGPNSMNLTIAIDQGEVHGVRVFSEPSHTLLAVLADSSATDAQAGGTWYSTNVVPSLASRTGVMRMPLVPGAVAAIQTAIAPVSDDHVDVFVFGQWALAQSAPSEDHLLISMYVNLRAFSFGTKAFATSGVSPLIEYQVNCGQPPCEDSIICNGRAPVGTCCGYSSWSCPNCTQAQAFCGIHTCLPC